MNSLSKTFLLIGTLGLGGAICLEIGLFNIGVFFVTSSIVSIMFFPVINEMFKK